MGFYLNPIAYYLGLVVPLLSLGWAGALATLRWPRAARPAIAAVVIAGGVQYWWQVSPRRASAEALLYFWPASLAIVLSVAAAAITISRAARRRAPRPAA